MTGIGGYFMRSTNPAALGRWYRECLGLEADANGLWSQGDGPTVFATFESDTDYLGSRTQQVMINFRVRDLDAMLEQLRRKGADVAEETQDMEGVGRFGWVTDPEGNRVELVAAHLTAAPVIGGGPMRGRGCWQSQPEDQVTYGGWLREERVVASIELHDIVRPAGVLALLLGGSPSVVGADEVRRRCVPPGR